MANFKEEIARIRAFVFDVDGVFTDGKITLTPEGEFLRAYNSKDGYALSYAIRKGYKVCVITAGLGKALEMRFRMLKVHKLVLGCLDKSDALEIFMREEGLSPEEVMYMGDDMPDLEAMRLSGIAVCPADAVPEVIEASHYVSPFDGGRGCIRDVVEQVLRARGDWGFEKGFNFVPVL